MRILILSIFFSHIASLNCIAQKHDYNWMFGFNNNGQINSSDGGVLINFNTSPPTQSKVNTILNFFNYCAVASDSAGFIMFYTNGFKIYTRKYKLMENGDSLNYPGWNWNFPIDDGFANNVGPFALPYPGHPNQYMLFHTSDTYDPDSSYLRIDKLYFTLIDMNANSGDGKVIVKNQLLMEGDLGWPAACKHGNGRDWWITIFDLSDPEQRTFLLSPTGISGPFVQQIGPSFSLFSPEQNCKSLFSPDGRIYIRHDGDNGPRIMDFDRCTGLFSNMKIITYPPSVWSWSASFSPNSRFLYLFKPSAVWRMDLKYTNPAISFDTLSLWNYTFCPYPEYTTNFFTQEGPDGKIYVTNYDNTNCLSRIERPNLPGYAEGMAWAGFSLLRRNDLTTCHFPNYRLGEYAGSPCDTINLQTPNNGFDWTIYSPPENPTAFRGTKNDYVVCPLPIGTNPQKPEPVQSLSQFLYQRWLSRQESVNKSKSKHD